MHRRVITLLAAVATLAALAFALSAGPAPRPTAPSGEFEAYGSSRVAARSRLTPAQERAHERKARRLLAAKKRKYKHLKGVTVEIGYARGYQAVAYYRSGRIIISPNHRASLKRIVNHEIWHIIDWRNNHRMNWGENLPPRSAARYRR